MTINDILDLAVAGTTPDELAAILRAQNLVDRIARFDTRAAGYSDDDPRIPAYWKLLTIANEIRANRTPTRDAAFPRPEPELVLCDCGHRVPAMQCMSASLGTACPDCYDRLSE
jgi:hypothetical protein